MIDFEWIPHAPDIKQDIPRLFKEEPLTEEIFIKGDPDDSKVVKTEDTTAMIAPKVERKISVSELYEGSGRDVNVGAKDEFDEITGPFKNEMQSLLIPNSCESTRQCSKVSEDLKESLRAVHSNENLRYDLKKSFTCKECKRIFRKQSDLAKHFLIHTGERPFECNVCYKEFRQKGDLRTHIKRHTGEKRHLCPACGKVFVDGVGLKSHMITHTGERKFKCSISACTKSYAHPIGLQEHMLKHTGGRYFKCNYCHKSLTSRTGLKWHLNRHAGIMPHNCTFCSKTYNTRTLLERHILSHTGERPYICPSCGKAYSLNSSLKRHLLTHRE